MSNYTKTTNFAAKDSLPSGNAAKVVKGTEIDTEFNNIATAVATKADTSTVTTKVPLAGGTMTGNLVFNDNVKAVFGTSSDGLEIFHNGSDSVIADTGTGILKYSSGVDTVNGTVLKIENTSSTSGSGAYVELEGALTSSNPKIGTTSNYLTFYTNGNIMFRAGGAASGSASDLQRRVSFYDHSGTLGGGIITGSGAPEGSISAIVGTLYLRTDGGSGSTLYVKESGNGTNTGWAAK